MGCPQAGVACPQHSSSELLPFGSLSSGEEEEGREEEKKEKMEAKAAAAEEEKEQEEVELALAEMKAKELAELKRYKEKEGWGCSRGDRGWQCQPVPLLGGFMGLGSLGSSAPPGRCSRLPQHWAPLTGYWQWGGGG